MTKIKKMVHDWAWIVFVTFCAIGLFYPMIGAAALICMLAPVITSLFKGRMWCGNFCPRGSFLDRILSKVSLNKRAPGFLKKKWVRNTVLALLMAFFAVQMILAWSASPTLESIGLVFVRMILATTAIAIVLGVFYKPRAWCMICPMGTMAHYGAKFRKSTPPMQHVTFDSAGCVSCNLCTRSCPMEINVLKHRDEGKVLDANCLKCNVCVKKCPKKSLKIA